MVGTWLNSAPISHDDWRGRATVLVFWAASCEASWVQLRRLEALRARLGHRPLVIAVHSPRLQSETDAAVVVESVRRHALDLPVVHDPELLSWARYGVDGRPTTVVIDHRRRVVGAMRGLDRAEAIEGSVNLVDQLALTAIERSGARPNPLPPRQQPLVDDRPVWSSVTTLDSGLVVAADTLTGRLVTFDPDGSEAGSGSASEVAGLDGLSAICAFGDGAVAASFADLGRVEIIELATGERSVIATELVRPRGLTRDRDGSLVVADSAGEQLVRLHADGTSGAIAGSGFSGLADGAAGRAELTQPVALTRVERGLVFSEAGSNALRILADEGTVMTLTANDKRDRGLLDPGLIDGPAHGARLCRPLALASLPDGRVVVADTGNDRLRVLENRRLRTIPLVGLRAPESLAVLADGRVIVADTGNARMVVVDVDAEESWELAVPEAVPFDEELPEIETPDGPRPRSVLGCVGGSIPVGFAPSGRGPWTISIRAEPSWLLTRPVIVQRSDPSELVVINFAGRGDGELVVDVTGQGGEAKTTRHHVTVLAD